MCQPVWNSRIDSVLFSQPCFDKPRCACPCLTCHTVFQKRSKPLLGEGLSFTSNLVFIDECLLTLSLVKIAKISCECFPLEAAIWPSQLRKLGLFTDEASITIFTKCDCDNFTWVEIPLELLHILIGNLLEVEMRSEAIPRRYNQLTKSISIRLLAMRNTLLA